MNRKTLYIIRGLPGSGKSSLGDNLASSGKSLAADDWFTDKDGNYNFDPQELPQAHEDCELRCVGAMLNEEESICVSNTFSQRWEIDPYFKIPRTYGYSVFVIECQNQFGNVHNVPIDVVEEMEDRWEKVRTFNR